MNEEGKPTHPLLLLRKWKNYVQFGKIERCLMKGLIEIIWEEEEDDDDEWGVVLGLVTAN